MGMDEQGFLSPDTESVIKQIRGRYPHHFRQFDRIHRLCHEIKYKLHIQTHDGQQVFSAGLFMKLLEDIEGAIVLIERGMSVPARSLLRVAIECLITLANMKDDPAFAQAFAIVGERQRLKLFRGLSAETFASIDGLDRQAVNDLVKQLQSITSGSPNKNIEQWAKNAGLSYLYEVPYRLLCSPSHSDPYFLERSYFKGNERGELEGFLWGPFRNDDMSGLLIECIRLLIYGANYVGEVFKLDVAKTTQQYDDEMRQLNETCLSVVDAVQF